MEDAAPGTKETIDALIGLYPALTERLSRQLLARLHREGHATIEELYREARQRSGRSIAPEHEDPNRPATEAPDAEDKVQLRDVVFERAAKAFTPGQVQGIVHALRRREEAEGLESIASLPDVPFDVLRDAVGRFTSLPKGDDNLAPAQTVGIRVALTRHFISDQLEFLGVAKGFLRISDFEWILDRVIGPAHGQGRIGGKAAGMYLGFRILQGERLEHLGTPQADVHLPESWFLRSDVIESFLRRNHLDEFQSQKYKDPEEIRNEYPLIRELFRNGEFPPEMVTRLERLLEEIGPHPVIVRSSSLLEDRFGAAFSGMYASLFLGNQGPRNERLRALLGAVAEVYASTLAPSPLLYRRRHNLLDYNEDMAILIQKVVGRPHGRFFLPEAAGVAFSRNEYRWSPRIKNEDGMARIVYGLGTRAVDRTGNDYSRLVALGAPRLRPEVTPAQVHRYSQRQVDAIDLSEDVFRTVPLADVVDGESPPPGLELAASIRTRDAVVEPTGILDGIPASRLCITFDRLLGRTPFAPVLRDRLHRLEDAYGVPVNIEFAVVDGKFYLLQCRPLVQAEEGHSRGVPRGIPRDRIVFATKGLVRSGDVRDVDTVVLVDPRAYDALPNAEARAHVARVVARVNDALEGRAYVLMGPGRWGSTDARLGVRVGYADINQCRILVEIAYRKGNFVPEVSYGTHFFQDLVEDGIYYLALHPDDEDTTFDASFLLRAENALAELSPRDAAWSGVVHAVRVADAAPGHRMHVAMDGANGEAMGWLE